VILAQQTIPTPEIAWSSFAPELLPLAAAILLLMMTIAGRRRALVVVPIGLLGIIFGAWLVTQDLTGPGIITVAVSAGAVVATMAAAPIPQAAHAWIASLGAAGGLALTFWQYSVMAPDGGAITPSTALQGSIALDGIALFTRITVWSTVLLAIPVGYGYLRDRGIHRPEFEPLLLLSATGMAVTAAANDLITMFVAYEVMSISLYVLAGFARRDRRSQESAVKYFVVGAVTSAILLYGMALLYVATGSLQLADIGAALGLVTTPERIAVAGMVLVMVGVGFKVALAPFQLWAADVYQGAPSNVTAFMAAATKAAGFGMVLRLFYVAFPARDDLWVPILAVLAAVTMLYGAIVAIVQTDVKRMLAYSSVAHAGYAAIGVASSSQDGLSSTLWYLLTYAVGTMAAFGAVIALERRRQGEVTVDQLRGLGQSSPAVAVVLSLSLLSFAGIPPTAGFAGKLAVFQAGIDAGLAWLVVIGVVSSVIAAFFYLKLMGTMFLEPPREDLAEPVMSMGLATASGVAFALIIYLGIQPGTFLQLVDNVAFLAR